MNDQSLYDISFNDSIQHFRHALALNEDRRVMTPEYLFPEIGRLQLSKRSIVQAWFLGAHIDIGGSAAKDGLSLYPLQWMLLESQSKGLVLRFDGSFAGRAIIDNPLDIVFPPDEKHGKGQELCSYKNKNKFGIEMQDLRQVHTLTRYGSRYGIHVNRSNHFWMLKKARQPFSADGELEGYCNFGSCLILKAFYAY